GGATEEIRSPVRGADVVQLERVGDKYVLSVGRFGDSLAPVRITDLALGNEVYVGLFVCAHNDTVVERATFRDVRITAPARDGFVPYQDYIGSNLEVLEVATGDRTIVYRSPESIQAPNWTKDGKALIYNSLGLLYRFDLADRRPVAVNTGSPAVTTTTTSCLSTGERSGSATTAQKITTRQSCTPYPSEAGRRGGSRGWARHTCTAGRRTGGFWSTPDNGAGNSMSTVSL